MIALNCPHCGHDESLSGYDVTVDGTILQRGGMTSTVWEEECSACGEKYQIKMVVGPVTLAIQKAEAAD